MVEPAGRMQEGLFRSSRLETASRLLAARVRSISRPWTACGRLRPAAPLGPRLARPHRGRIHGFDRPERARERASRAAAGLVICPDGAPRRALEISGAQMLPLRSAADAAEPRRRSRDRPRAGSHSAGVARTPPARARAAGGAGAARRAARARRPRGQQRASHASRRGSPPRDRQEPGERPAPLVSRRARSRNRLSARGRALRERDPARAAGCPSAARSATAAPAVARRACRRRDAPARAWPCRTVARRAGQARSASV